MIVGRDIRAVVPVKRLDAAKQRLAPLLAPANRRAVVRAMLADVLDALAEVRGLDAAVATSDPEVAALAAAQGADILEEETDRGYAEAALAASRRLAREGCGGMLLLPGDVPGVTAAELRRLLAAHGSGRAVTIVPSRDRAGTNALLLTPPDAIPMLFGPDSFRRHREAAEKAGIELVVLDIPGIALDLDDAADVAAFMRRPSRTRTLAALRAALQRSFLDRSIA